MGFIVALSATMSLSDLFVWDSLLRIVTGVQ